MVGLCLPGAPVVVCPPRVTLTLGPAPSPAPRTARALALAVGEGKVPVPRLGTLVVGEGGTGSGPGPSAPSSHRPLALLPATSACNATVALDVLAAAVTLSVLVGRRVSGEVEGGDGAGPKGSSSRAGVGASEGDVAAGVRRVGSSLVAGSAGACTPPYLPPSVLSAWGLSASLPSVPFPLLARFPGVVEPLADLVGLISS